MIDAGLILEGGGMRGAYTAGVLDCLMDEGIYLKNVYGVSAGACHACSYISKQRSRAIHTIVDYVDDKRYASLQNLIVTGEYLGTKMIYDDIPNKLIPFDYKTFKKSSINLYAVLTNCESGVAEYHKVNDLKKDTKLIKASSSLPSISRVTFINKKPYLDGGISDSIPLQQSIDDGNKKNIVVLTQHKEYRKSKNKLLPIITLIYKSYPSMVNAIATRHERYNESLELVRKEVERKNALVIQPKKPVEIGRLEKDREKLWELYYQGYNETKERLPEIRRFLNIGTTNKIRNMFRKLFKS